MEDNNNLDTTLGQNMTDWQRQHTHWASPTVVGTGNDARMQSSAPPPRTPVSQAPPVMTEQQKRQTHWQSPQFRGAGTETKLPPPATPPVNPLLPSQKEPKKSPEKTYDGAYSVGEKPRPEDVPLFNTWKNTGPSKAKGMIAPGTIDITKRPSVHFPNGQSGSLFSYNTPIPGTTKWMVTPGITPAGHILTEEQAFDRARVTGQHLGIFDGPTAEKDSEEYAVYLHLKQGGFQAYRNGGNYNANGEYWLDKNPEDIVNSRGKIQYNISATPPMTAAQRAQSHFVSPKAWAATLQKLPSDEEVNLARHSGDVVTAGPGTNPGTYRMIKPGDSALSKDPVNVELGAVQDYVRNGYKFPDEWELSRYRQDEAHGRHPNSEFLSQVRMAKKYRNEDVPSEIAPLPEGYQPEWEKEMEETRIGAIANGLIRKTARLFFSGLGKDSESKSYDWVPKKLQKQIGTDKLMEMSKPSSSNSIRKAIRDYLDEVPTRSGGPVGEMLGDIIEFEIGGRSLDSLYESIGFVFKSEKIADLASAVKKYKMSREAASCSKGVSQDAITALIQSYAETGGDKDAALREAYKTARLGMVIAPFGLGVSGMDALRGAWRPSKDNIDRAVERAEEDAGREKAEMGNNDMSWYDRLSTVPDSASLSGRDYSMEYIEKRDEEKKRSSEHALELQRSTDRLRKLLAVFP